MPGRCALRNEKKGYAMILVTGGAGYIGSHMGVALAQAGQPYLVLDNFSNSQPSVLERMG